MGRRRRIAVGAAVAVVAGLMVAAYYFGDRWTWAGFAAAITIFWWCYLVVEGKDESGPEDADSWAKAWWIEPAQKTPWFTTTVALLLCAAAVFVVVNRAPVLAQDSNKALVWLGVPAVVFLLAWRTMRHALPNRKVVIDVLVPPVAIFLACWVHMKFNPHGG